MKNLVYGILVAALLSAIFCPSVSFSLQQSTRDEVDLNADISQVAIRLFNYHLELAEMERAKGNETGFEIHFGLAGIQGSNMTFIRGVLDQQEKEKIMNAGLGNCILQPPNGTSLCLRFE